jgi:hypothetical protein
MVEWTTGCAVVDGREISFFNARERDGGVGEFETGEALADFSVDRYGEYGDCEERREGDRCVSNGAPTDRK